MDIYNKCVRVLLLLAFLGIATDARAQQNQSSLRSPSENLYTYRAIITKVYDGDTVTADIDLGMKIWLRGERLRLWGIDTPEIRRGNNRALALRARDFLRDQILGKQVTIKTIKDRKGKYGRYLAVIYINDVNINELMIKEALAVRYLARR